MTLTPTPNLPYQASGWVDHAVLRFKVGADQIEVIGKSNLLQKSDYGTVWVLHDPEPPRNKTVVDSLRRRYPIPDAAPAGEKGVAQIRRI
jgi:hypothetical protein